MNIMEQLSGCENFESFCRMILKARNESRNRQIIMANDHCWSKDFLISGNNAIVTAEKSRFYHSHDDIRNLYRLYDCVFLMGSVENLVYFEAGEMYLAPFEVSLSSEAEFKAGEQVHRIEWKLGKWRKKTKLLSKYCLLNTKADILCQIEEKNRFLLEHIYKSERSKAYIKHPEYLLMAPELEQLEKAGFTFLSSLIYLDGVEKSACDKFNRLCSPGKNMKEIFKIGKPMWTALKNNDDIREWDAYRKINKKMSFSPDEFNRICDLHLNAKEIETVNTILSKKHDNKPVFSWVSLMNYLGRLDRFEAISTSEALPILADYLMMCETLNMKPHIDGDSLKREHDIAARLCKQKRNQILAKAMEKPCEELKKYDYEENVFFIRGIRSYDDLVDEALQQDNCVAGYATEISKGKSFIYVMREKARPDKSLITVELSKDGTEIRQKRLAHNAPIRNKAQTDFLKRWLKFIKSKKEESIKTA